LLEVVAVLVAELLAGQVLEGLEVVEAQMQRRQERQGLLVRVLRVEPPPEHRETSQVVEEVGRVLSDKAPQLPRLPGGMEAQVLLVQFLERLLHMRGAVVLQPQPRRVLGQMVEETRQHITCSEI
jgi:hypothetical protein